MKQAFIITDLGPGDGGKGGVVHGLCHQYNAHTVIKVGGAQGSHGVRTSNGKTFNFSQFGCGTFEGIPTYISNLMVIEPYRLLDEANQLRYAHGVQDIFNLLTIDDRALCITPFHTIASRLNELARKDNPKGTIGIGAGEAMLDFERSEDFAIFVRDIPTTDLKRKLVAIRDQKIKTLKSLLDDSNSFWEKDQDIVNEQIELLFDEDFIDRIIGHFEQMYESATIVDEHYLANTILSKDGTVVVESSHGVLTDRYCGFVPTVSRLRTLPNRVIDLIKSCDYSGEIKIIGVTRAYQIRHGAGPLVTHSPKLLEQLLPGSSKENNRWQGDVRVGALDFVSLRYSVDQCGGHEMFTGIAVTWFDQIQAVGTWEICDQYSNISDQLFFNNNSSIRIENFSNEAQLLHQKLLSKVLYTCKPIVNSLDIKDDQDGCIKICQKMFSDKLNIPVHMISFGPTEDHKVWLK